MSYRLVFLDGPSSPLSPREREVMELLSRGLTGEQIADRLVLSRETVKTHIRNAMSKLTATTRVHAVAMAMRLGYIDGPPPASPAPGASPSPPTSPSPGDAAALSAHEARSTRR